MRNLPEGSTMLIVDEPAAGLTWTDDPDWSLDGTKIVFDASPGKDWTRSRMMVLEERESRPAFRDLGLGNSPKFSPDGQTIAFLLPPDTVANEAPGVYVMRVDGSDRRRIGLFGAPFWSRDGKKLLVNTFGEPTECNVHDLATGKSTRVAVPGLKIFSWPRWAGNDRIVACIGRGSEPDAIVLLDVSRPDRGRVVEMLWNRRNGPDVYARWPLFVVGTGDCYFVGVKETLRTLLMVSQKTGDIGHVHQIEGVGQRDELGGLGLSPDGKFLLFCANRPDREKLPARAQGRDRNDAAASADRLADVLKRKPPRPSTPDGKRMQVYLRDLKEGGTTLIADEPVAGLIRTSSPTWSSNGRQIAFHATPENDWGRSRLLVLSEREGRPAVDDLGHGSCPAFGPDDETIAFLVWPGPNWQERPGVWTMRSDGSQRRRLTDLGAPFWSPDGQWMMINHFGDPTECRLHHLATGKEEVVRVAGHEIWSWPRWVGPNEIVAVIRKAEGQEAIALLDVSRPASAEIVRIRWSRGPALDVLPRWPLHRAATGETLFVGVRNPNFRNLFSVSPKPGNRPEPRQEEALQDQLEGLSLSPGGRYLLFNANRPGRASTPEPGVARPVENAGAPRAD
jgi:Tol biopolymer transport system component